MIHKILKIFLSPTALAVIQAVEEEGLGFSGKNLLFMALHEHSIKEKMPRKLSETLF